MVVSLMADFSPKMSLNVLQFYCQLLYVCFTLLKFCLSESIIKGSWYASSPLGSGKERLMKCNVVAL